MSFIKNFVKNFVLRSDMFAAQPTLRLNGQSSYETIFGGCLSILLVTAFAVIFSKSFITVINKVDVSASLNLEDNPYDDNEINDIRMAIGVLGLDFSEAQRYFNIILKVTNMPLGGMPTQTEISLTSCSLGDWQDLGDNFGKLFQVYNMSKMLCPSASQNLTIKGFEGSSEWVTMSIYVQQCQNMSGVNWTCYPPLDIKTKFETYLTARDFLKVSFLLLNTVISPQQEDATKAVLQNQIFVTFSNTSGSRCQLKLGRYQITTDNSIWPVSDETTESGYYLASHDTYTVNLYSTHYVRIQIEKARTIYQVSRVHDKLDEMLSYAGGLFSLLFGFLFFFIGSYNEYRYEVAVAEHAFALDQTGRKITEDSFGFWTYLKYCLFDWLKTFGLCITWKRMEEIDAAKEEACQQMDIRYLMKKIQRFELMNKLLMGQHNLIMANLSRPPSLEQVKRMRKITEYYDKVIKVENEENLLSKIIGMSQVSNQKQLQVKDEKLQEVGGPKFEQEFNLDQSDQQVQKQIADIYKEHKQNGTKNDPLAAKIMQSLPQSIKDRLSHVQNLQNSSNILVQKQKLRIQSCYSIGQGTPNVFISGFMSQQS